MRVMLSKYHRHFLNNFGVQFRFASCKIVSEFEDIFVFMFPAWLNFEGEINLTLGACPF